MLRRYQHWLFIGLFAVVGAAAAPYLQQIWASIQRVYSAPSVIYQIDTDLSVPERALGWADLLPDNDKKVLRHYQVERPNGFDQQVLRSIEASVDSDYRAAMQSTNIVSNLLDIPVSLPGFIVPLDIGEQQRLHSFFLVPYFGACLHFPPPPPNQMVYVHLTTPIKLPDINLAYVIKGTMRDGLYEDQLGTAAYELVPNDIRVFHQNPDDFRRHNTD